MDERHRNMQVSSVSKPVMTEKQKFKTKKKFELSCLDSWYNYTKKNSTTLQFLNVGIAFVPKSEEIRHSTTGNLNWKSMYDYLIRDCLEKFVCKQIDKRKHAISKHCTIFISSVLRGMSLVIIKSTNVDHKLTNICREPFKLSSLSLNTNRRPDTWYLFMPIGDHIVSKTTAQICYMSVLTKDLMQRRHWLVLHKLHICHMKKSN